jgi:predicted component of type VI protein secretion system
MFTKDYFLTQLRNGQSIDTIGQSIADAMNEAVEAYEAEQAAISMVDKKRDIALDMIDLLREYGTMVMGEEACDFMDDITDEDLDSLVESMDQLFNMMKALTELKAKLDKAPATKSDDDILANFIRSLS